MTAQGSPLSVLRRAIRGGSLRGVEMALIEVPAVDLQDALEIVFLMDEAGDPRFHKWAQRWVERAASEDAARLQSWLDRVPDEAAKASLRARAVELRGYDESARIHVARLRINARDQS